jgi:hypothetical protein
LPYDWDDVDLSEYRHLVPGLQNWVQFPKKGNCQIRQPIKKKTGMALVFFYFSFMVC